MTSPMAVLRRPLATATGTRINNGIEGNAGLIAYNQPSYPGFYLGSDLERSNVPRPRR